MLEKGEERGERSNVISQTLSEYLVLSCHLFPVMTDPESTLLSTLRNAKHTGLHLLSDPVQGPFLNMHSKSRQEIRKVRESN